MERTLHRGTEQAAPRYMPHATVTNWKLQGLSLYHLPNYIESCELRERKNSAELPSFYNERIRGLPRVSNFLELLKIRLTFARSDRIWQNLQSGKFAAMELRF